MVKRKKLTEAEALKAEKATSQIPVRLAGVDIRAALKIAAERNIYAYDA
jgi:predicted nucleic acid-binding protein